jgi:hypothetical protein
MEQIETAPDAVNSPATALNEPTIHEYIDAEKLDARFVSLEFDWGTAESTVTLSGWETDGDGTDRSFIRIDLTWRGEYEQPEVWTVSWSHFTGYLATELVTYVRQWCPGADEVLETLTRYGLPEEIKAEWERESAHCVPDQGGSTQCLA